MTDYINKLNNQGKISTNNKKIIVQHVKSINLIIKK